MRARPTKSEDTNEAERGVDLEREVDGKVMGTKLENTRKSRNATGE